VTTDSQGIDQLSAKEMETNMQLGQDII